MKIYRTFAIILSIVLGISLGGSLFLLSPTASLAVNNPVNEEHYQTLKANSILVATTLDKNALTDKSLKADFYFNDTHLIVTVNSVKAKVTAKVPISNYSINIKDNTINIRGTPDLANVIYEEQNLLNSPFYYISLTIIESIIFSYILYSILCGIFLHKFNKH